MSSLAKRRICALHESDEIERGWLAVRFRRVRGSGVCGARGDRDSDRGRLRQERLASRHRAEMTAMQVYRFNRALVRVPSRSVVEGLRAVDRGAPDFDGLVREHAAYVRALEDAGVAVERLEALEAYPDSVFVEDAALVFSDAAIVLRPGAPSRRGEADEIAPALEARFARVLRLEAGSVDGGDVLTTAQGVFIGQSARTTREGAQALVGLLRQIDLEGRAVATPRDVLHFKSDCALLDEETVLATARLAASDVFAGFRVIVVPDGEEAAANAVRINDRVLISEGFAQTAEMLAKGGYNVVPLSTREVAKLDAGLSCLSLRWRA
jgi:dimethylargininase